MSIWCRCGQTLEGLIVPSKFYGVAAVGRATIFIGDRAGEIAGIIAEHDCGLTVAEGDAAALAATVQDLADRPARREEMGSNARRTFEDNFDKPIAHRGLVGSAHAPARPARGLSASATPFG